MRIPTRIIPITPITTKIFPFDRIVSAISMSLFWAKPIIGDRIANSVKNR